MPKIAEMIWIQTKISLTPANDRKPQHYENHSALCWEFPKTVELVEFVNALATNEVSLIYVGFFVVAY